jgi:predicted nucleic acid-binding protein
MIAATALSRNLPILTANAEDFNGIEGLEVVPIGAS